MVYFRSFLAGLAATILAEILILIVALFILLIIPAGRQPDTGTDFVFVGWDPVAFARTAPGWIILLLAFVAGFFWQYRRFTAH